MVFFKNFMFAFEMFLVVMGIATLITGAIGVSNIMQVVLEERTKEIGIKMALGARSSYIVTQFMIETLMITACGGVLGFLFASTIITFAPKFLPLDDIGVPMIDPMIVFPLVGLLGLVGLLAGLVPARRAAKLQPVQALKLF
jgi:putative ABC transport system permease protein